MILKKPSIRLSLALALFTVNLLLLADLLGFYPDTSESVLEMRKSLSESMALQFTAVAEKGELQIIQNTLRAVVERNKDIRSAAIRTEDGHLVALAGDHLAHWDTTLGAKSTPTHVHVPIYRKGKKWATVQIRFAPMWADSLTGGAAHSLVALVIFVGLSGFICYFFIIRRTLRELDPSAVIPERVYTAFNVLQEGVLLLDDKEQIVMANKSFAKLFGEKPEAFIGRKGSEMGWLNYQNPQQIRKLPWFRVLKDGLENTTASLSLLRADGSKTKLAVNVCKVSDSIGNPRGCLVTFDDITQIEEKNFELSELVEKLQQSKKEIQSKSQELEFLASRDPLTLCLNRRAMDKAFDALFVKAKAGGSDLSCLMVDIDFFKSVNDRYGHATGDEVIKAVADVLKVCTRDEDLVGRYGGEEFCVILPLDLNQAEQIAERIRRTIEEKECAGIQITTSVGVSSITLNAGNPDELVNQADKALYAAKKGGRNRVVTWGRFESPETLDEIKEQPGETRPPDKKEGVVKTDDTSILNRRIQELEGLLEKRKIEFEHYEMYDRQTGLSTRSLFEDRIAHEIARSRRQGNLVAVISITIDTFERVEKTLGLNAAMQLMKACGNRLNDAMRRNIDTVAVLEEFKGASSVSMINPSELGILLADIKQVDPVTWIIRRLLNTFNKSFQVQNEDIFISAYIGVGIFPYDGQTVEELYRSATNACTYAKREKDDNRYRFASQDINTTAIKQLQIENALYRAVDNDEFELHFQPLVKAATNRISGFEALLRWTNPDLGPLSPGEFIPIAERSGQIQKIGEWVLVQACKQLRDWQDMGLETGSMAVNLSGLQLRQSNLAHRIREILDTFNLDYHLLEIELTESLLIHSHNQSFAVLKQIRDLGVRVSMDDFGTGYSSLAYLRNIPLTSVKIDRSFIDAIGQDEHADKLVASIVSMAHGLGLEVVAEGIEEPYQAKYLTALGCEYLQGYFFGRPSPPEEACKLMNLASTHMKRYGSST